jgi:hypothetical protein
MVAHLAALAVLFLVLGIHPVSGQNPPQGIAAVNADMSAAALKFWNSLTPQQQAKAGFPFANPERTNWHFTPGPWNGVGRKGLPWKEMTPEQVKLGHELVRTGLSEMGYTEAQATQINEDTLGAMEKAAGASRIPRDPQNYYISIFGKPGTNDPWGWRFEGHHVAFNFTVDSGTVTAVASPNFLGANPAKVPDGYPKAGSRILAGEEDLGRALVKGLSDEQRKTAIINAAAPREIITGEQQRPTPLKFEGLSGEKMSAEQKKMMMDLVSVYINRQRSELAQQDLDKIEKAGGADKLYFAWAGSTEVGAPHYYRVQGPTFLIEYDNTQNNANHIHAVWRDATNDFGEDLLKKHYAMFPQEHP